MGSEKNTHLMFILYHNFSLYNIDVLIKRLTDKGFILSLDPDPVLRPDPALTQLRKTGREPLHKPDPGPTKTHGSGSENLFLKI